MSRFLQNLFRRFTSPRGPAPGDIHVAAFGKHPGWADHVDLGLDTERLADIRQSLYVQGIAGNLDSGAWDRLPPEHRLPEFDHALLWHFPGESTVAVARLWSSQDGKGRGRYPMVAAAQCPGMPPRWALRVALPALEGIRSRCRETTSASAVEDAVIAAKEELRPRVAADGPAALAASLSAPPVLPQLLGRPELGDNHRGLLAVIYHLERTLADGAGHLRLPPCAETFPDSADLWLRFILERMPAAARRDLPILALQPIGQTWLDVILGHPRTPDYYCILATPAALPRTTDIPYNLEPEFIERATASLHGGAGFQPARSDAG